MKQFNTSSHELDRVQAQLAAALQRARDLGMHPDSRPRTGQRRRTNLPEPTGIRVAPEDASFVERRSA